MGWLSISLGVRGIGCWALRHLSAMPAVKSSRVDDGEMKLRLSDVSACSERMNVSTNEMKPAINFHPRKCYANDKCVIKVNNFACYSQT